MKILISQLARLGDILQTIPTINALHRTNPGVEIHLLVRGRFKAAAELVPHVSKIWILDSENIFEPLFKEQNLRETQIKLRSLLRDLRACQFAQVINLSFSPASSFITALLAGSGAEVRGYTRHSDGFFNPNDDASAYFYGQVGIGKNNRAHITDLLAQVAGVNIASGDWFTTYKPRKIESLDDEFVAIHVGASQANKIYPAAKWAQVINSLSQTVVLVGAVGERKIADEILSMTSAKDRVINLVGRSTFLELFDVIAQAELLIGADSAPMAMAPFTKTPCLNLSSASVSFWETGPRSVGSRVLFAETMNDIQPQEIGEEVQNMLSGRVAGDRVAVVGAGIEAYEIGTEFPIQDTFEWQLVKALYMGGELPVLSDHASILAMSQLREVNQIVIEQTTQLLRQQDGRVHSALISQADDIISEIKKLAPMIKPLVSWYEVERTRIPPDTVKNIAERTLKFVTV